MQKKFGLLFRKKFGYVAVKQKIHGRHKVCTLKDMKQFLTRKFFDPANSSVIET